MIKKLLTNKTILIALIIILLSGLFISVYAESTGNDFTIPNVQLEFSESQDNSDVANSVKIILILTVLTIAPSILIMMTCFTRFVIVLSMLRKALALQTVPPNQVIIGLALFLTFFVMAPTFKEVNEEALQPFINNEIGQEEAYNNAVKPFKTFMLKQVRTKDIRLFMEISGEEMSEDYNFEEIPITTLIPAFIISELKTGFEIGFLLFIPFIVIDMIVASTLMALGMMMLPPVMISLPFKILLFIMVDGWYLIVEKLVLSVR